MTPAPDAQASDRGSAATLLIDGERIALHPGADTRVLIGDVMKAVLAGGGFVHVESTRGDSFDILVTPRTRVIIWHRALSFESNDDDPAWQTGVDVDY